MKQLILTGLLSIFMCQVHAQLCMPDTLYRDSTVGVYPPPMSATNPNGGITEKACINSYYEFTFTFKVPESLVFNTVLVTVDSIVLNPDDPTTISGLPDGLEWSCNPGTCVFDPVTDSLACALVYGTTASSNTPGDYTLAIKTKIYTRELGALDVSFPNPFIPGADGTYAITVVEEGSSECFMVSTDDLFESSFSLSSHPNPVSYYSTIEVFANATEDLTFSVYDLLGRQVHSRQIQVFEGKNTFEFDASNLTEGVYLYTIGNEQGSISRKLLIGR